MSDSPKRFGHYKIKKLLTLAFSSVTGASFGKQLQTITNPQYAKAKALIGNPNRPKLHRAGGRDSPWMRFNKTHPILIIEGRTEIYETEENGEDGGQIDGIRGDVEFVVHLKVVRISEEEGLLVEKLINPTLDIHNEHGKPLSLEKAHNSLLVVANAVIFPEKTSITTR
ncbi:hypothetical protein BTUL_0020g00610 [Botrytis tulipae]|uniref:Uncharacterized protein n=1 Tax=Botrytis tulipae TaxID=87230 RepID=A0A4Z1F083_9HELO|nr:hypothetical protein BTUL_0020g00610 [Botrytis tulipae]